MTLVCLTMFTACVYESFEGFLCWFESLKRLNTLKVCVFIAFVVYKQTLFACLLFQQNPCMFAKLLKLLLLCLFACSFETLEAFVCLFLCL